MKKIRFIVLISIVLFVVNIAFSQNKSIDITKLDKYLENARKAWGIPGMSVTIVSGDSVLLAKGYGLRDVTKPDVVDKNTLFAIASNTKAFTSAALSILVDEGKISWDDKVIKYLPWFQLYDPFVTANMTIRDLLCHRSGLETFSGDLLWYATNYSRKEVIERARFLKPKYGFRSAYGYSNIMFLAAGEIIPAVTGKSWDEFLKEKFFVPLEMKTTNTSIRNFNAETNLALPHHVVYGEKPIVIPYINWDNIAPAGSINSNANDMANWLKMQLNNGKYNGTPILSEAQLWEMRAAQTPRIVNKGSLKYFPSRHFIAYALGWETFDYHGAKIVNHGGGADGMISKVVIVPEEKFGFVILTNSINYLPSALTYTILDEFFGVKSEQDWSDLYLGIYKDGFNQEKKQKQADEATRRKDTKPSLNLKEYTGTYGGELYGNAEVSLENDHLVLKFVPTPMFVGDLSHWQFDTFSFKFRSILNLPEGKVNFVLDEKGKVEEMRVNIPNPDFDFTELIFKKK